MELSRDNFKIYKLCDDNFYVSKSRIQVVLSLKELDELIDEDSPAFDSDEYRKWRRSDNKSKAVI